MATTTTRAASKPACGTPTKAPKATLRSMSNSKGIPNTDARQA